jgi:hypothetical protein
MEYRVVLTWHDGLEGRSARMVPGCGGEALAEGGGPLSSGNQPERLT